MFDFHLHSSISFDSECPAKDILAAAEQAGLREICFTDHYDFNDDPKGHHDIFSLTDYRRAYDSLTSPRITVRRGVEFGLTHWNAPQLKQLVSDYDFDFVIGSTHYAGGYDPYFAEYWEHNGWDTGFERHLQQTLACVKSHEDFDVLGHLNYVCKSAHNPTRQPLFYKDYADLCDEIMRELVKKGKGMEINTSGMDRVGEFLPSLPFIRRFRELGGEILTVGSDAHDGTRVGQYTEAALAIAREVFGYVCTFEKRKPIVHKL